MNNLKFTQVLIALTLIGVVFANPNWDVNPADYQYNGSVTSSVSVDGLSIGAGDQIGAFVGDELRGVGDAAFFPVTGSWIFLTMIFSNQATGESLSFKLYDAETDQVIDLDESIPFVSDMTEGNGMAPFSLSGEVSTTGPACDADPSTWSVNAPDYQ